MMAAYRTIRAVSFPILLVLAIAGVCMLLQVGSWAYGVGADARRRDSLHAYYRSIGIDPNGGDFMVKLDSLHQSQHGGKHIWEAGR